MALVLKDRVKETTTTTGTADFTLVGAVTGFQSFSVIGNGNTTYYAAVDPTTGDWEVGVGTYSTTGPTLTRNSVLESSNAGSKVVFAAGPKDVFCTYPAERSVNLDAAGSAVTILDIGTLGVSTANISTANITSGTVSTTPTSSTDIANKTYVDTQVSSGITYHSPVKYEVPSTTGNLTANYNQPGGPGVGVGATLTNAGTLAAFAPDGPTAQVGDRILVYNQTNAFENGVYTVTTVGSGAVAWVLTRSTDTDTYSLKSPNGLGLGDAFFVTSGDTGAGETYVCNTSGTITFGTTNIAFVQISSAQVYSAGTGLNLSPATTFNISNTGVTASTYGSGSNVPVFAVNAQGQITSVTNTAIAISAGAVSGLAASATTDTTNASNITSGTLPSGRLNGSYTGVTGVGTLTAGTWNGSTIAAAYGGTGLSSYAVGDLIYADTTTSLAKLADVVSGNVLLSGGVGTAPAWGQVGLQTHVTGTLQVTNGGTGLTTFVGANNALYSTGANTLTAGTLPVAAGGSGTSSPSLVAGSNVTISGSWPNQTISASSGGGSQVGDYVQADTAPSTGTWLLTGGYYSKTTYPALAAKLGNIPDLVSFEQNSAMNNLMYPLLMNTSPTLGTAKYISDTDGSKMVFAPNVGSGTANNLNGGYYTTDGENFFPSGVGPVNELRYLNNKWIACGNSSAQSIMVSDDGVNWRSAIVSSNILASVAYGNGIYICTTTAASVYYVSSNAETWATYVGVWDLAVGLTFAQRTSLRLERIRFANGIFVACGNETSGSTGVIISTTDGITWVGPGSTGAGTSQLYDVVYGNSIWVAVGGGGTIRTSPDGITWTLRASGFSYNFYKVIFANGLFVAVADLATIRTSSDGVTWSTPTLPIFGTFVNFPDVVWTGSQFIVPIYLGGKYLTSTDGTTWTLNNDSGGKNAYTNVIHFNGKTTFLSPNYSRVLLGTTPKTIAYGYNGQYNQIISILPSSELVAYGAGVYVIVADNGTLAYSNDGVTFNWVAIPECNAPFLCVQYLNNYFLAGIQGNIYYSTDGITWLRQAYTPASNAFIYKFAYLPAFNRYVAVTSSGIGYATTLTSWTSAVGTGTYNDIVYFPSGSAYVAVGNSGLIQTSSDGVTWTARTTGTSTFVKVVYGSAPSNRLVLQTSSGENIYETADAVTFTLRATGLTNGISDICWDPVFGFTAVENTTTNPRMSSSANGTSWTAKQTFVNSSGPMQRVFADGLNRIVFLRQGTIIKTSDVGQTWSSVQSALTNFPSSTAQVQSVSFVNGRWFAFYRGPNTAENGTIETSVDTLTWSMIKPYPENFTGITRRIYNLNNISYVTSAQGLHYSLDQITWTRVNTVNVSAVHMAYGNNIWLCVTRPNLNVASAVGLCLVFKSTDGINFSYATNLNNIAQAGSNTPPAVQDLVFANGRFVVIFTATASAQKIVSPAYHSTDGVTWASSRFPPELYGSGINGPAGTDGSTIIICPSTGANYTGILKSTDGGQTFTQGPTVSSPSYAAYSNGLFIVSTSGGLTYISTDSGTNWINFASIPGTASYVYATNTALYNLGRYSITRVGRNGTSGISRPLSTQEIPLSFGVQFPSTLTTKSSDRLLVPAGFSNMVSNPNYIAELKFYSYDTTTIFYVPQLGSSTNTWVYAGP